MEKFKSENLIFNKLNVVITIVCVSILLAITSICIANANFADDPEPQFSSETTKKIEWTDQDAGTGKINIESKVNGPSDTSTPDVLFIGTACNYHGLTVGTINNTINSLLQQANVDFSIFNSNEVQAKDRKDVIDQSLLKGETYTYPYETLVNYNHGCLEKFYDCLYRNVKSENNANGKDYDYIILEFDRSRIADLYRDLEEETSTTTTRHSGDKKSYNRSEHEADVARMLVPYYEQNKIIWITDWLNDGYTKDAVPYSLTRNMIDVRGIKNPNMLTINYNALKGMFYPEDYVKDVTQDKAGDFNLENYKSIGNEILAKYPNFDNDIPESALTPAIVENGHVTNMNARQISYTSSALVGEMLSNAIKTKDYYSMIINDTIKTNAGVIVDDTAKTTLSKWDGEKWVPLTKGTDYIITWGTDVEGNVTVKVTVQNLSKENRFKLEIPFTIQNLEEYKANDPSGNANYGPVVVTIDPNSGEAPDPEEKNPNADKTLDWPVNIGYVSNGYGEVSNSDDNVKAIPADGNVPKCSTAQNPKDGYTFHYWTKASDHDWRSTNSTLTKEELQTTDGLESGGRYYDETYTAVFDKSFNVTYDVKNGSGYQTIPEPIDPTENVKVFEGDKYTIHSPLKTMWQTEDGKSDGVPGVWQFSGWYDNPSYSGNPVSGQITIKNEDVNLYGKWDFYVKPNIVKDSNFNDSEKQPAQSGDVIKYTITVENPSKLYDSQGIVVSDVVPLPLVYKRSEPEATYDAKTRTLTWSEFDLAKGKNSELTFEAEVPTNIEKEQLITNVAKITTPNFGDIESNEANSRIKPLQSDITLNKVWANTKTDHSSDSVKVGLFRYSAYTSENVGEFELNSENSWTAKAVGQQVYVSGDSPDKGSMFTYVVREYDPLKGVYVNNNENVTINSTTYTANYKYTYKPDYYFYDVVTITNTPLIKDDDIVVDVKGDKDQVNPGETITYTVDVTNTSDGGHADNVVIENKIPERLVPVDEHPGGGTIEHRDDGDYIVWTIDDLPGGTTEEITYELKVRDDNPGGDIVNGDVAVVSFDDNLPKPEPAPDIYFPPPAKENGIDIIKTILKLDDEYISTVEDKDNIVELKYAVYGYEEGEYTPINDAVIKDVFPPNVEPAPGYKDTEWKQEGDHWVFTRNLGNIESPKTTTVNVIVKNDTEENITLTSAATLNGKISNNVYAICSNEVSVLIPAQKVRNPITPVNPPKPINVVVSEVTPTNTPTKTTATGDNIALMLFALVIIVACSAGIYKIRRFRSKIKID